MGGLGNQMFQYALGRRLSVDGHNLRYDTESGFVYDFYERQFALEGFNTYVPLAKQREIPMGMNWRGPSYSVAKVVWVAMPNQWRKVMYEQTPFCFDDRVVSRELRSVYLYGYWQTEMYFRGIREILLEEFTLRNPSHIRVRAIIEDMAACRSISVHVRRKYAIGQNGREDPRAKKLYSVCDEAFVSASDS